MSFLEIFQPGLRHLREERDRQRMDIAYPTNGADPLIEIDLDAGVAILRHPAGPNGAAAGISGTESEGVEPEATGS